MKANKEKGKNLFGPRGEEYTVGVILKYVVGRKTAISARGKRTECGPIKASIQNCVSVDYGM